MFSLTNKKVKAQEREDPCKVKNNTRATSSWYKVAMDVVFLEVGRRFLLFSSQVWNGMPVSHGKKITARWCLMVLIKGVIKQLILTNATQ